MIFGRRFNSGFDESPGFTRARALEEWGKAIAPVDDETIGKVLIWLRDHSGSQQAPNLSQFMGYCRQFQRTPAHEIRKALPEPEDAKAARMANGLKAIKTIRESLEK